MDQNTRRAISAAYKEKKSSAGIYAVRCAAAAKSWIGQSPTIDTVQTRLWFTLRQGGHPNRDLQADWKHHGEGTFVFEILERLEDEDLAFARDAWLKDRQLHWRQALGAAAVA